MPFSNLRMRYPVKVKISINTTRSVLKYIRATQNGCNNMVSHSSHTVY